jgi:hypothetical protein
MSSKSLMKHSCSTGLDIGLRYLEVNMCQFCYGDEPYQVMSFPTCEGCKNSFTNDGVSIHEYDLFKRFREFAEFVNQKRVVFFCRNCIEEMDKYWEYLVENKPRTEITIPENWDYRSRYFRRGQAIPVGTHHYIDIDQVILGIRCAKQIYGTDAVEEILQGFVYHDDEGHMIKRLTLEDMDESMRCDKCWLPLYECNAREVTR